MYNYIKILLFLSFSNLVLSQSLLDRIQTNDSNKVNMDAIYNRPFLNINKSPIAIGGYMEANSLYESTDGVTEGLSFQMRRLTLFFASTISNKIKFISELEFEDGTKEINIENAMIDMEFHPLLNLRGGILFNPIGAFNQNHDGPRWEFIDRPIASTEIIPSTLSNVGFGIHGKYFAGRWILAYETYLTNGFDDKLIANERNRTSFREAKKNVDKFEESFNGSPSLTAKIGIRNRKYGEIGFSSMHGIYNKYKQDGLTIDKKRKFTLFAVDFNTSLLNNKLNLTGEIIKAMIQLPENYLPVYGSRQFGFYTDLTYTLFQRKIFNWENSRFLLGFRLDYSDYNQNKKSIDNSNIGEHVWAFTPSLSFRPNGSTVLRFNYKYQLNTDFEGNDASKTGRIMFGLSSYF